jgi:hypothetical protein
VPPLLRVALLTALIGAGCLAGCGAVTPASGPPSYGDGRDRGGA